MSKNTEYEPSNISFRSGSSSPLSNLCALILAKWFPIVDTETQGCNGSTGIAPAQFEGQNLNSLHPFAQP